MPATMNISSMMTGKFSSPRETPLGRGQAEDDRLNGQQPAGLQRVTLERHRQRKDKLEHQDPAGDERIMITRSGS